ncbi:hypothetical protein DQ04_14051000, partial [Trypanosoma grayi]|uniref:hypothetical protein n=1 Tax=Trypanosoma grayi TaxID=71804 RepID=UPI0004F44482
MGTKDASDGTIEDVCSGIPRWCLEKMTLLSREEIEAMSHVYSDTEDEKTNDGTATHRNDSFKARMAALPMFLQTEALLLRCHEQEFRQCMKELVELSECIVMVCDGALRPQEP